MCVADFMNQEVSTHSRLKAAAKIDQAEISDSVSTHSRLKAAVPLADGGADDVGFNTQPPEGG